MRIKGYEKYEKKEYRFARVATKRTKEIIRKIQVLGNCSNRNYYSYDQIDVDKIFDEITKELKETRSRFYYKKTGKKEFKL